MASINNLRSSSPRPSGSNASSSKSFSDDDDDWMMKQRQGRCRGGRGATGGRGQRSGSADEFLADRTIRAAKFLQLKRNFLKPLLCA